MVVAANVAQCHSFPNLQECRSVSFAIQVISEQGALWKLSLRRVVFILMRICCIPSTTSMWKTTFWLDGKNHEKYITCYHQVTTKSERMSFLFRCSAPLSSEFHYWMRFSIWEVKALPPPFPPPSSPFYGDCCHLKLTCFVCLTFFLGPRFRVQEAEQCF